MTANLLAKASITIDAPVTVVWQALIDPDAISQYMFGTEVVTDWRQGGPIAWKGEYEGKAYEDKGVVLRFEPSTTLQYTHFSALSGEPDKPENYHKVTIGLAGDNNRTDVSLVQDGNPTEQARESSEKNWAAMLDGLRKYVES